eukprot:TRINITY_DN65033_c0_g1_i1.p1 TRINITY_DN65033_c0_g1~~TRINITY_DN65033_c0_g1_i1.p1  ORF type:complete len:251 (+),score=31.00 TRINITY_DN65033_c0_g1_i1:67-819(+)
MERSDDDLHVFMRRAGLRDSILDQLGAETLGDLLLLEKDDLSVLKPVHRHKLWRALGSLREGRNGDEPSSKRQRLAPEPSSVKPRMHVFDALDGHRFIGSLLKDKWDAEGNLWTMSPSLDHSTFMSLKSHCARTKKRLFVCTRLASIHTLVSDPKANHEVLSGVSMYSAGVSFHYNAFAFEATANKGTTELLITSAKLTEQHLAKKPSAEDTSGSSPHNLDAYVGPISMPSDHFLEDWWERTSPKVASSS